MEQEKREREKGKMRIFAFCLLLFRWSHLAWHTAGDGQTALAAGDAFCPAA
jgi:hypothetical protein